MKKLIILTFMLCAFPFVALANNADTLNLEIKIVTGERGRDSSSTTRLITIAGDTVVYKVTYGGRNRGRLPEELKEFKLESKDRTTIINLLKDKNLLTTASIEREQEVKGNYYYFAIVITSKVYRSEGLITLIANGLITIKGPRNATDIREAKLYTDSVALIKEVYLVMDSEDDRMTFEPPIR